MTSSTTHRGIIGHSVTHPPRPLPLASVARLDRPRPHSPAHGFTSPHRHARAKSFRLRQDHRGVKTPVAKRGATIVRRNSKGGEEGARDFGNTYVLGRGRRCERRRAMGCEPSRGMDGGARARGWARTRAREGMMG